MQLTAEQFAEYLQANEGNEFESDGTVFTYSLHPPRVDDFPHAIRFASEEWNPSTRRTAGARRIADFLQQFNQNPFDGWREYKNRDGAGSTATVAKYLLPLMWAASRKVITTGDTIANRHDRISSFQTMMLAGSGTTRLPDERGRRFDHDFQNGEFLKSGLHDAAYTLKENVRRLDLHATIPIGCFNYGRRYQEVFTQLCAKRGISPRAIDAAGGAMREDLLGAWQDIGQEMLNWIYGKVEYSTTIGNVTNATHVAGFAVLVHHRTGTQIESLCESLIIEAWSLFEALAEDLWEAALNEHPTVLASLSGQPKSKLRDKAAHFRPAEDAGGRISFNDLQANGFDVKRKMGTILKDAVSFRSLPAIRDAYLRAFSQQHQSIDDILDDEGLQYTAAARNVIVHKRGFVDKEYLTQVAKVTDALRPAVGERLALSGELCARLCDSCRCCAVWLVNAVHAWIIGHPAK